MEIPFSSLVSSHEMHGIGQNDGKDPPYSYGYHTHIPPQMVSLVRLLLVPHTLLSWYITEVGIFLSIQIDDPTIKPLTAPDLF